MKRWNWLAIAVAGAVAVAAPVLAKKNVTRLELEFTPQQSVATAEVTLNPAMQERAVSVRVADGRPGDREVIGSRTDDDDRRFDLTAGNDVAEFVAASTRQQLRTWDVAVGDDADLVLDGKVMSFKVVESNQAVGATYNGSVQVSFELKNSSGTVLWSGTGSGDATRYGKKFSSDNANEVLSDSLIEALANLLSNSDLHAAWSGK